MDTQNFVLRIYDCEKLIEQRFVLDIKMATYFVQSTACYNENIWGELFELKSDDALLISIDGTIEKATEGKK